MGIEAITNRGPAEAGPLLVVWFLLSALFLHWGTAIAGVPGRAYFKALLALLVTAIVLGLAATVVHPIVSAAGGAIAVVSVLISVKVILHTGLWRSFVACLVGGILTAVMVFLTLMALG